MNQEGSSKIIQVIFRPTAQIEIFDDYLLKSFIGCLIEELYLFSSFLKDDAENKYRFSDIKFHKAGGRNQSKSYIEYVVEDSDR